MTTDPRDEIDQAITTAISALDRLAYLIARDRTARDYLALNTPDLDAIAAEADSIRRTVQ